MKFLIKIFCLLSFLSSFGFSFNWPDASSIGSYRGNSLSRYNLGSSVDALLMPDSFIKIDNDVYQHNGFNVEFVDLSLGVSWAGFQFDSKNLTLYSYFSSFGQKSLYCLFNDGVNSGFCKNDSSSFDGALDVRSVAFSYVKIYKLSKFTTCNAGENFNTNLKQCLPACPAGQSWDAENNLCYVDCSDKDLNKYGYPNGTAQGGCIDCSNALSDDQIMRCFCSGFCSTYEPGVISEYPSDPSFKLGSCKSGDQIRFKSRLNDKDKDKDKKKDNNSTNSIDKGKENPKPDKDKDKKNDNNSTNSSNKDNKKEDTKPNKKDNNENSNNSSGESGNPSNNNSGVSSGNGSSGGGGTGVEIKPNPNNGNGKEDGKSDGKQDGKGDDAVAQKLDYGDLEKGSGKFEGEFKKAVDDSFSFVNDVKASLTDTIQKIKDGNLMSLKKGAVPTTCPLSFQIDMTYFSKNLTFDFCKIVSPVSSSLYILFYLGLFILFLVVTIKLFILTFMGW